MFVGDRLTNQEIRRMQQVLQELLSEGWAEPLLRLIEKRGGITVNSQPELFEARAAHLLMSLGLRPDYEFPTGIGDSSVDFRVPGRPEFLIEVVSLRVSAGARAAQRTFGPYTQFSMSSNNQDVPGRERESLESEVVVAQGKLGEKVFSRGRCTKFPEPAPGQFHVLLADARGLAGRFERIHDIRDDLNLLTYGYMFLDPAGFKIGAGVRHNGSTSPLKGVFEGDESHPLKSARFLRERVHAIHFVCELEFTEEELSSAVGSYIVTNRNLITTEEQAEAFIRAYPLASVDRR